MINQTLNNRYKITERLGKGAMGTVYKATDTQTGQVVAVKVIASDLAVDPSMLERFRREGETLRQLKHLNIVGFVDAFQHDDHYVIIMEYVSGGSLFELIKSGPLSIERAVQISLDLCDALIRSHRLKIIHRDIKPENVLIDEDGAPKLADFGVARLSEGTRMTRSGMQVGTPYYMAPEAWEGKQLDAQADIWSLGVMLFEMLTGQLPFVGDTPMSVMNKVNNTSPPDLRKLRADVPPSLVRIISKMLTKNKSRRYQTMREVAVDLERDHQGKPSKPNKSIRPEFSFEWFQGISGIWNKVTSSVANLIKSIFKKEKTTASPSKRKWTPRFWWYVLGFIAVIALIFSTFVSNAHANDIYYTKLVDGKTEIYQYKDGQNILILGSNGTEEYWHPAPDASGNLYFTSTTSDGQIEIFRYDTDRVKEQFTTQTPKPFSSWNPAPDILGNLYFASDQEEDKTEIYVIDINGIKSRVTHTEGRFESWSPAPDGLGNVYFVSNQDGNAEIFVIDAKGVKSQVTNTSNNFESWSPAPDGIGNLYFISNQDRNIEVFVIDANGIKSQVTHTEGNVSNWSPIPDGFGNLYFTSDRNGKAEIFVMDKKGAIQPLADIPSGSWLRERFGIPSTPENSR